MRNPINNLIVPISPKSLKTCNRCGCDRLAWVQLKSQKWVLVRTATERPYWQGDSPAPEGLWAVKNAYHNCDEYRQQQAKHTKAVEDCKLRETWCHPKADKPLDIMADILTYLWTERCSESIEHQHFMDCATILAKPMQELTEKNS